MQMGMVVCRRTELVTVTICHDIAAAAPPSSAPSPGGKGHDAATPPRSNATSTNGPTPREADSGRRKLMTMAAVLMVAVHLEAVADADGMLDAWWMTLALMTWEVTAVTTMPVAMVSTLTGLMMLLMAGRWAR